jgi:hypothetical protein
MFPLLLNRFPFHFPLSERRSRRLLRPHRIIRLQLVQYLLTTQFNFIIDRLNSPQVMPRDVTGNTARHRLVYIIYCKMA